MRINIQETPDLGWEANSQKKKNVNKKKKKNTKRNYEDDMEQDTRRGDEGNMENLITQLSLGCLPMSSVEPKEENAEWHFSSFIFPFSFFFSSFLFRLRIFMLCLGGLTVNDVWYHDRHRRHLRRRKNMEETLGRYLRKRGKKQGRNARNERVRGKWWGKNNGRG